MSTWYITNNSFDLMHYGVKGRSGRKPGSGVKINSAEDYRRYKQRQNVFNTAAKAAKKSSNSQARVDKIAKILKLKNVSEQRKAQYIKKLLGYITPQEKSLLLRQLSRNKMYNEMNLFRRIDSGKVGTASNSGARRVNSAYDARSAKTSKGPKINSPTDKYRWKQSQMHRSKIEYRPATSKNYSKKRGKIKRDPITITNLIRSSGGNKSHIRY